MVSPQLFAWAEVFLVLAACCCLTKLIFIQLASDYPAFALFLVFQIATGAFSQVAGTGSPGYAYAYVFLIVLEWMAYGWMLQELYAEIFRRYPGIAIFGQWCVYGSAAITILIVGTGIVSTRDKVMEMRTLLVAFEFASQCLLFGYAALIIVILLIISRYPMRLPKNTLVVSIGFSLILLGETLVLIVEHLTSRRITYGLNAGISILGAFCMVVWTFSFSKLGQTAILQTRTLYELSEEIRLLAQLGTLNTKLLRFARR